MNDSDRFSYRVFWSQEDGEYVAVCAELPGLSWLDKNPERALKGIRRTAGEAIQLLRESGDAVPSPLSERRYSGVFKVRVPPEVHRRLVLEAGEQSVSLNRLVSAKLAAPLERAMTSEIREPGSVYRRSKPRPPKIRH